MRVHFFVTSIRVSSDDQLTIVGTIQATLPCDLETFRCRLTWLGMLALDKTEHKSRSPNRAFPETGCSKSACSTGHYRQNSTTFGHQGQKCVSDHDGSDFFQSKLPIP